MKRAPLRRHARLQRYARLRPRRPTRRRSERVVDEPYLAFLRLQSCQVAARLLAAPCRGRIDPHHGGKHVHGLGLKPDDDTALSCCRGHHDDVEAKAGPFKGWTWEQVWGWCAEVARDQRAQFAAARGDLENASDPTHPSITVREATDHKGEA